MPTLTAAQILKHPELTKVTWDLKPTKAGDVQVAEGRGGPFPISYEIHGRGDVKLVVSGTLDCWVDTVESSKLALVLAHISFHVCSYPPASC